MRKVLVPLAVMLGLGFQPAEAQTPMKFFVPNAAGPEFPAEGIEEADDYCSDLGYGAGYGDFEWRAYLDVPAKDGSIAQKASDRVGEGPWFNFEGILIAEDVAELISDDHNLNRRTALDQRGFPAYGGEETPSPADILKSGKPDPKGIFFCFAL